MDYEKKYKEALERARVWQNHLYDTNDRDYADELNYIFPELAESGDEKIRKQILSFLKEFEYDHYRNLDFSAWIAWLEKQGKQKPTLPKWKYKNDNTPLLRDSLILNKYGCVAKSPSGAFVNDVWVIDYDELAKLPKEELEKQGEQETLCDKCRKEHPSHSCQDITELGRCSVEHEQETDNSYCQENCKGFQETGKCFADGDCKAKREAESTDKNEPKFHEGDWVVSGRFVTQIREIAGDGYVNSHNGFISFEGAKYYHLWTIQDAKDGDVLFHSDSASNGIFIFKEILQCGTIQKVVCYCDYDSEDHFCLGEHHTCCWTDAKILYPATKEQRDLLFQKMKEAGYSFDFEKKELKKLGHSEVTKTSDQEEIAEIPFGAKDSELQEATYYIPKGFHAEIDNDKVVIKKGNKEDESWFKEIELMCLNFSNDTDYREEFFTWLKSLKQRIGG